MNPPDDLVSMVSFSGTWQQTNPGNLALFCPGSFAPVVLVAHKCLGSESTSRDMLHVHVHVCMIWGLVF